MRRIRMKKSRKYEQDKLQAAINASARRALDDLEKSSGMLSVTIDRKSTRLNSSHPTTSRMPSSA